MRLYELASADPEIVSLIALSNQIRYDLDHDKLDTNVSVEQLLKYFRKFDVNIGKKDLYNLIKQPPLKSIISNIKNDKVIFKGYESIEQPKDISKKIVQKMANKAKQ